MDFLTSFAIICICSLLLGSICAKIKLPPLLGMLIIGIIMGPYVLNIIAGNVLAISSDLRQLALIIILTRAGLNLNLKDLRKNGRSAILLCFLPATVEICAYILLGVFLLKSDVLSSALLGCVMAAVSPAVIVPRMLKLKGQGYGTDKGIPDIIMAGSSADDVFVIVIFTALCSLADGGSFSWNILWKIPLSMVTGIGVGIGVGMLFVLFIKKVHIRDSIKVILMLAISCLFIALQNIVQRYFEFSGLLAVISFAAVIYAKHQPCANRLSQKYSKLWLFAEIVLFVLVGAEVDLNYVADYGLLLLPVIFIALICRMAGVLLCLVHTKLTFKERFFVMLAYTPKATVQAAIGAIPLGLGLACGQLVLTAAVMAILITAPLGAFAIDLSYKRLLCNCESQVSENSAV